jgi:hypothetical protein
MEKDIELEETNFPGCLEDNRTEEAKSKDYIKDLALFGPVVWQPKNFRDLKVFPVRNQGGSGTCVMQTGALMCGIENFLEEEKFIEFSIDLYNFRENKDSAGMIGVNALQLLKDIGLTLEVLIPSMNMTESQVAQLKRKVSDNQIAKIFRIKDYWQLPFSVDAIATIMENGRKNGVAKPVMVWFQFPRIEWDAKPQLSTNRNDIVRHSVTAIDYGMVDGKKGIFIQDSWGLHSSTENGLRFISEDYLNNRMIFCAYVNDKLNNWQELPNSIIKRTLRIGMRGDDVKELQGLLKINVDGIFGKNTKTAVINFQTDKGLLADGIVGPITLAKLLS